MVEHFFRNESGKTEYRKRFTCYSNEGYKASGGEHLIRAELCHEAIRLAALLAEHPSGDRPRVHAVGTE